MTMVQEVEITLILQTRPDIAKALPTRMRLVGPAAGDAGGFLKALAENIDMDIANGDIHSEEGDILERRQPDVRPKQVEYKPRHPDLTLHEKTIRVEMLSDVIGDYHIRDIGRDEPSMYQAEIRVQAGDTELTLSRTLADQEELERQCQAIISDGHVYVEGRFVKVTEQTSKGGYRCGHLILVRRWFPHPKLVSKRST